MPNPPLVELRTPVPQQLVTAAQQIAWASGTAKRDVIRLALALGLERLGAIFTTPEPQELIVKRGRPRKPRDPDPTPRED